MKLLPRKRVSEQATWQNQWPQRVEVHYFLQLLTDNYHNM